MLDNSGAAGHQEQQQQYSSSTTSNTPAAAVSPGPPFVRSSTVWLLKLGLQSRQQLQQCLGSRLLLSWRSGLEPTK